MFKELLLFIVLVVGVAVAVFQWRGVDVISMINYEDVQQTFTSTVEYFTSNLTALGSLVTVSLGSIGFIWKIRDLIAAKNALTQQADMLKAESEQRFTANFEQQKTISDLEKKLASVPQPNEALEELVKSRDEAQSMVTVKAGELSDVQAVVRDQAEQIRKLLLENDLLKPKPIP